MAQDLAEQEGPWDLDGVQVRESFEGPDASRAVQRRRHKEVRVVFHLDEVRDVFVVARVRVDQAFL